MLVYKQYFLLNNVYIIKNPEKYICVSESYNANISNQLFGYKLTFMNSKHEKGNLKVILYLLKNQV